MAGYYGTAELQPYQEQLQGSQATSTASPDDLKAFYEVMHRKDLERKKSNKTQRKSTIWSRKSVKRSVAGDQATSPTAGPSSQPQRPTAASLDTARDNARHSPAGSDVREMERLEEQRDIVTPLSTSRSIIPEALNELPAWYPKDDSAFRMRYNLHNPVGPRRYYNHHLIPPSHKKPSSRPPSIFSPSFPPMATSSQDSEDLTRLPGPSRTPSNSPLPTPSSSQVRVADVGKPRSRKTSQTAHDGVDLLDVSDPWGTNWHHQSPYDVGLTGGPVNIDVQENGQRPRHTSMTTREARRRTVTPSPLSQSTSAVHLSPNLDGARIPRKLSKRRTSALGIFGNGDSKDRHAFSAPSTPLDDAGSSMVEDSKHMGLIVPSSAPPSSFKAPSVMTKKERRGSVLGRLVKKFSILKRPHNDKNESLGDAAMVVLRSESPEKSPQRRVPPPSIESPSPVPDEPPTPTPPTPEPEPVAASRVSISSIEPPFSMGKLTIANPDAPDSDASTPQPRHIPLPSTGNATTAEPYAPQHPPSVPSSQSSTLHAPSVNASSMGTVSPVPSSSMQVLSETMKPEVRDGPSPPQPSVPHRSSREISPAKPAGPSKRSSSGSIAPQTSKRSSQSNGAAFPTTAPAPANGHSQEKRKSRSPEKKPVPPMVPPKAAVVVPFPSTEPAAEQPVPHYLSAMISTYPHDIVESSPLSAASILVNPPTPYAASDRPIPPSSPAPTLPPKESKRPPREPSPSTVSKQTETFKLVRSMSGSVYASTETIIAAGQQWEVVEDSKGKVKESSRSKSKSKESSGKKEHRKDKERTDERESRKHKDKGTRRSVDVPMASTSTSHRSQRRASSVETQNSRAPISDSAASPRSHKREESSGRRSGDRRTSTDVPVNVNKPQPPPPPPTPGVSNSRPLERNPSVSARPTSEVPTAADLNAMRGKEAWEMERLFKAQSMYGIAAATAIASGSAPTPVAPPPPGADTKPAHGSSHTSYTVQNAFQSHPASHVYPSIPTNQSHILTPHSQSLPQNLDRSVNGPRPSFPSSHSSPAVTADVFLPTRTNPLPEPPRDSPYQPANLDSLLDSDYWTKYAGVTTAH